MKDELHLLPTDKRQMFLQITIIILGLCGQACQHYLFLCNILKMN